MALPPTQQSREYNNFVDVGDGTTARQVTVLGGAGSGLATEATLQSVDAKLADLKTYTDQLEGYVDNLESLNTQILAAVDGLESSVDGVEGLITATNSALSTVNSSLTTINTAVDQLEGYVDGLEAIGTTTNSELSTVNTNLSAISGYVDGLEGQLTTLQASITAIQTNFDVALSTRASEATQLLIKARADLLATEATLSAINAKFNSLGQKNMAGSVPVAIASNQDYPYSSTNNTANPSETLSLGADDSTNIRRIQGRISNPELSAFAPVVRPIPWMPACFTVTALSTAPGNGKSMLSVFNAVGSTVKMRLLGLWIYNVQTTAVTGVINSFGLRKITAHSAGTQLTTTGAAAGLIMPHDSSDSLDALITARTGATVTESPAFDIRKWLYSSDEFGAGTADAETHEHSLAQLIAAYRPDYKEKPYTFNAGEGFSIRQGINTTVGTFDIVAIISQESP